MVMNKRFIAIDPGREKTGIAIFFDEKVIQHKIINSYDIIEVIAKLIDKYQITLIVMGNGTSSKTKYEILKQNFPLLMIVTINEYRTTDEARRLYFKMNPPKGLKRLIPLGMQVPPVPVDDYAAIVIGKKYLQEK